MGLMQYKFALLNLAGDLLPSRHSGCIVLCSAQGLVPDGIQQAQGIPVLFCLLT